MERKRKELSNDIKGIVDGQDIYSRRDLYEKDGYLCTFVVNNKEFKSTEFFKNEQKKGI